MPHTPEPPASPEHPIASAAGPTLDVVFKVFNCPRRREVLVLLAERRLHAFMLADLVSVDPGQLSRWMKLLSVAGLVEWESEGRTHVYGLTELVAVRLEALNVAIDVRTATGEVTLRFPAADFAPVLEALRLRAEPGGGS